MGMLSENSLLVLNQIGNLSWNGAAGAAQNPQQQNIGLVNEQGQPRVITFEGRDFGLLPEDAANAEGSNALRTKLLEIAEEAGLKPDVMADIQGKLGLSANAGESADVPLLDRRIAGAVARQIIDSVNQVEDNIRAFRDFAAQHGNAGDFYVRLTGDGTGFESAGHRNILRGSGSKQENNAVRQRFFDCVSAHYNGNIPESVRTVMTNFNGGGHPLSAKRINLICQAMDIADCRIREENDSSYVTFRSELGNQPTYAELERQGVSPREFLAYLDNMVGQRNLSADDRQVFAKVLLGKLMSGPVGLMKNEGEPNASLGIGELGQDVGTEDFMLAVFNANKEVSVPVLSGLGAHKLVLVHGGVKFLMESGNGMQVPAGQKENAENFYKKRLWNPFRDPYSPEGVKRIKAESIEIVNKEMPSHLMVKLLNLQGSPNSNEWTSDLVRTTGYSLFGKMHDFKVGDGDPTTRAQTIFRQTAEKFCNDHGIEGRGVDRVMLLFQAMTYQASMLMDCTSPFSTGFCPPIRAGLSEIHYSVEQLSGGVIRFKAQQGVKCPYFADFPGDPEYDPQQPDKFDGEKSYFAREIVYDFNVESIKKFAEVNDAEWGKISAVLNAANSKSSAEGVRLNDQQKVRDQHLVQNMPEFIKQLLPRVDVNYAIKIVPVGG